VSEQQRPEPTDEELAAAIERLKERSGIKEREDFSGKPEPSRGKVVPLKRAERLRAATEDDNVFCERCGGAEGPLVVGNHRHCKCQAYRNRRYSELLRLDPGENMTFEKIENPDSSLEPVIRACREIAGESRTQGLMLFGKPGVGKTHVSVATSVPSVPGT